MTKIVSLRTALLMAGTVLLAGGSSAVAQEGVAVRNILGTMGIINPDRDAIRYRERAPLVLPPKMDLREPLAAERMAVNNPQWPADPDVVSRNRRAAEERRPLTDSEVRRMSENNPRLSVEELRAGRTASSSRDVDYARHSGDKWGVRLSPDELRSKAKPDEDAADEGPSAEPNRKVLTDPPTGMRRSATGKGVKPSFAPKIDQQEYDANPMNWVRRQFSSSDDE